MPSKSLEWMRYLPVEVGNPRARSVKRPPEPFSVPSATQGVGALLQAYEQMFLEKEQLRSECVELRRKVLKLGDRATASKPMPITPGPNATEADELVNRLRGCVKDFQEGLQTLESKVSTLRSTPPPPAPAPTPSTPVTPATDSAKVEGDTEEAVPAAWYDEEAGEMTVQRLARIVSEWVFPTPNEAQVRLVEDALKGRGVAGSSSDSGPESP